MSNKEQLQQNNINLTTIANFMSNQGISLVDIVNQHLADENNPHNVTATEIGAVPSGVVTASVE